MDQATHVILTLFLSASFAHAQHIGSHNTTARKREIQNGHPLFTDGITDLQCSDLPELWAHVQGPTKLPTRRTYAYLIMGEDDITSKEKAMWSLGADVFTLTYKTRRSDSIYCPDLRLRKDDRRAFARGRNTLFLAAKLQEVRQGWSYAYYIFLDSDVEASAIQKGDFKGRVWTQGLRRFHGFLEDWEPAVGVPLYEKLDVGFIYTHMFNLQMDSDVAEPRTVYWHDQMFVAIHHEAIKLLFPLDAELDMSDAVISQWNMSIHASLLFRGHVLVFKGLQLRNPAHGRDPDQYVQVLMENSSAHFRAKLPPRLQHCVLDPWNAFGFTASLSSFRARHIRPALEQTATEKGLRYVPTDFANTMDVGERGVLWVHSYYPWGRPAKKKWRYDTATLATSPSCDDEPEYRNHWWGDMCLVPGDRNLEEWLSCTRYSLRGRSGPYLT